MKTRTIAVLILLALAMALPASAAFKLPVPEKFVLKNGITVYFLRTTETPIVSFRLMLRGAGSAQEPAALEGIASLTAELLQKGAGSLDADAVAEAVDFMGARLAIGSSEEMVTVSADSLSEHFAKLLRIAADCIAIPSFKEDEFQKAVKTRRDGLKSVKDSPGAAVRYYFTKAYYGTHPLGHLGNGSEESLAKMTPADVKAYHQSYYGPAKAVAAVVGDIDKAALTTLLNATFGKWKGAAKVPAVTLPPLPKPQGIKLLLVDKPDANQAYWILGAPGYALGDPQTPAAAVMNTLFGGRFTSWLSTELRIKRGLTYGASSSFAVFSSGGTFTASSYTKNDKIGEMLQIAFDLLKKARTEGFSAEEVESSRNYIQGQFPPTLETNASKAGAYARLAFFSLGFDYYDRYLAGIQKSDQAAVKAAAARLLPSDGYVLVVVGKSAEIKAQLAKFGTWTEKKISDPGF
ncbi:MAG: pitrilysin family protein [Candidatus Aminicenantes bacterium]|nr:pitrilysin family protein [Candidatus Aminicenantes bacterium]